MPNISITKDELMKKLRGAKAKADREDAKIAAKHRRDEEAALIKFRNQLKAALGWDWSEAKKHDFGVSLGWKNVPTCPKRNATAIDLAIAQLETDSRKPSQMLLSHDHEWMRAAMWLPSSERPKESVCD